MKELNPEVLYEDNHLLAINKPAGMLSQSDITADISCVDWVRNYLKERYNKPGNVFVGLCHRLDRPVSGILLFAKTGKALERINSMFRAGEIKKIYWAITDRKPSSPEGTLNHFILKDVEKNRVVVVPSGYQGAKKASTVYSLLRKAGHYHLMELKPETGRSHQLRIAMKTLQAPILGDVKYGGSSLNAPKVIALHHRTMTMMHPVKKTPLVLEALPAQEEPWSRFLI